MIINHNIPAINNQRNLWQHTYKISKTQEKLSSGQRINRAADDAAALAISETMLARIGGVNQADRNAQDAVSLIQTADGALSNTGEILARMRELAVQAANGTYTADDRKQIQNEIDQLKAELDRVANTTSFNNKHLLDGTASELASTANSNTKVFMRGGLIDANGVSHAGSYQIQIALDTQGTAEMQTSNIMRDRPTNSIATANTQLKDVAQFYDQNGRFLVANPQTITLVEGDGKRASFTIDGNDTLASVAAKFNQAIAGSTGVGGLGQGAILPLNSDMFATITTQTTPLSMEATSGVFCLRSAIAGDDGKITVVADQSIINAFGFTDYQAADNAGFQITITNADTGQPVSQAIVKGNEALGLIYNTVDVKFDPTLAQSAVYSVAGATVQVNTGTITDTYIHLVDNNQTFQIGANELQNINSAIGNMGSNALGIGNLQLTDAIQAGNAITKIDMAYQTVNSQRAYLGSIQNRLDTTINNLQVSSENIQSAESRIRDADMAKEMMEFTRLNLLTKASMNAIAQSNTQPQHILRLLGQ